MKKNASIPDLFKRAAAMFGCLLLAAMPGFAQQGPPSTGTITGLVHSSEGAPIPGATLRLTNTDTNKVWVSWTDESGEFEFPGLPVGHYRVETSQLGFVTVPTDITVSNATAVGRTDIVLRVATLEELAAQAGGTAKPAEGARSNGAAPTNGQNAGSNRPNGGGASAARGGGG
ncbi:MAG: carboxypeptidase-like regulatory domain-containing protein, partial [Candidatus Acidiferrales bacterium]